MALQERDADANAGYAKLAVGTQTVQMLELKPVSLVPTPEFAVVPLSTDFVHS